MKKSALAGCFFFFLITAQSITAAIQSSEVHLKIVEPIIITNIHMLDFGTITGGRSEQEVIGPDDPNAAVFRATGEPRLTVAASILEKNIDLTNSNGDKIKVTSFTLGGDLRNDKAQFNNKGELSDLRVGATAIIKSNSPAGDYYGTATFQLVYIG